MLKKLSELAKDRYFLIVFLLFIIGAFLRFYRLNGFLTFLGDQGRDAIIIKRMLAFEHFPAIGPASSIGQVYLGPFYYYFMAPWLFLFRFEPIGLAFGVAFLSSLFIIINYFLVKDLFNKYVALISTVLVTFSLTLIQFSRFSWNPNFLPIFALLTVYFLIKAFKNLDWRFFALAGAFLSFTIQLHYLALFLIPPIVIFFVIQLYEQKKRLSQIFVGAVTTLCSFFIFSIPLVIFDLRHNFLNSKNFLTLFKNSTPNISNKINNVFESFLALNKFSFNTDFNFIFSSIILALFIFSLIFTVYKKNNLRIFLIFFIVSILGLSFYLDVKYPHYFGLVYLLYYVLIAYFLSLLFSLPWGKIFVTIFLITYLFLNYQGYSFLSAHENNQIDTAKKIAAVIYDHSDHGAFRLTSLPQRYNDYTYRYFLEIRGKKPVEKDSLNRTGELFVVCEEECKPIGDAQWDVAYFAPRKIVGMWKVDAVTIYKLTR